MRESEKKQEKHTINDVEHELHVNCELITIFVLRINHFILRALVNLSEHHVLQKSFFNRFHVFLANKAVDKADVQDVSTVTGFGYLLSCCTVHYVVQNPSVSLLKSKNFHKVLSVFQSFTKFEIKITLPSQNVSIDFYLINITLVISKRKKKDRPVQKE